MIKVASLSLLGAIGGPCPIAFFSWNVSALSVAFMKGWREISPYGALDIS